MMPHLYFEKVKKIYDGDELKAWKWFRSPNAKFNMLTPLQAIKNGKEDLVKKVIDNFIGS